MINMKMKRKESVKDFITRIRAEQVIQFGDIGLKDDCAHYVRPWDNTHIGHCETCRNLHCRHGICMWYAPEA